MKFSEPITRAVKQSQRNSGKSRHSIQNLPTIKLKVDLKRNTYSGAQLFWLVQVICDLGLTLSEQE